MQAGGSLHTPSLATRLVVAGLAVVGLLAVALDLLLFFSLRSNLMDDVNLTLNHDTQIARSEGSRGATAVLATRLAQIGLVATVHQADGTVVGVAARRPGGHVADRHVGLPDGGWVDIQLSLSGVDQSIARLVQLELLVSPLVVGLSFLLLRFIAEVALRPLDEIAVAARRTAGGVRGERLRPDQPETKLGRMATAYDAMLDKLEAAIAGALRARARSDRLQEHTRQILETAREAFVAMDDRDLIVDWNREAERVFGWSKVEAIGRRVDETIIPPELREGHRKGLAHRGLSGLGDLLSQKGELTGMRRDGSRFPVEITVWTTEQDGAVTLNAFLRDVTKRTKEEEAVSRLAAIVESSSEAMLSLTPDGTILTWNQGAEMMYGYPASEAVGQPLDLVVPATRRPVSEKTLAAVMEGQTVRRTDAVRCRKDGKLIDVALTMSPLLDDSGAVCGACAVERDITEEHRMASALDATLDALEAALAEAQASEVASRRFLDDAAHQLRAPITSIRACAETLMRGGADEDQQRRLIGGVVRETARAGRLMTGLLRMARLNQHPELTLEPCDLVALCREEASRIYYVAPQLEVAVSEGVAPIGRPVVDRQAVAEILANLLDNAARHAVARIDLIVRRDNDVVELVVLDDGPGLPDGMAEAVFDRFVSLDGKGGSGLGLPIARQLAAGHGGALSYESKAFVLKLPATACPSDSLAVSGTGSETV